jgi:hypothetical protein
MFARGRVNNAIIEKIPVIMPAKARVAPRLTAYPGVIGKVIPNAIQ